MEGEISTIPDRPSSIIPLEITSQSIQIVDPKTHDCDRDGSPPSSDNIVEITVQGSHA
ncbi:hypothetical protein RchiOBHm_Chr2g0105851 [Rosa chinensis]|uniref:Uncharacterized protein n=1 Tax=Rosa chinensis TaxID=74649 RepID=A0A2P6RNI2_ROSCH|nr:hypothetical protein RchiOBHm_Chr2g0105851 [Rosa chinensis]